MATIPLTRQQIIQRAKEYQALADWTTVRDFCTQVYGEGKVHTLEIETYGEYNDEGGTNYSIESITAKDSEGKDVAFDLSLPFWQSSTVQKYLHDEEDYQEENPDDEYDEAEEDHLITVLKDIYWSSKDPDEGKWVDWNDLPCDEYGETYNLDEIPVISA